jgi:hypothetical protein
MHGNYQIVYQNVELVCCQLRDHIQRMAGLIDYQINWSAERDLFLLVVSRATQAHVFEAIKWVDRHDGVIFIRNSSNRILKS